MTKIPHKPKNDQNNPKPKIGQITPLNLKIDQNAP